MRVTKDARKKSQGFDMGQLDSTQKPNDALVDECTVSSGPMIVLDYLLHIFIGVLKHAIGRIDSQVLGSAPNSKLTSK